MRVKIDGKFFNFFSSISIDYKLDSVASAFSFAARFDPHNALHRDIFKPLAFRKVEIFTNDNQLLLTGYTVVTDLVSSSVRSLQNLSGYSKPGILEDCSIPYSSYPLEKLNVSLNDVAQNVLSEFDLAYTVDPSVATDMNLQYSKTVAQPAETIKSFIAKLAAQRNIILGHTAKGDLLFFRPDVKAKPKRFYTDKNTLSMKLAVNGQGLHSKISVIRQPSKDNTSLAPVDTVENPLILLNRSLVKVLSSGSASETKKAADNVLSSELKNIPITITLEHIDVDLKCGDIVEVQNPEIYLYSRAKLLISSIAIKESQVGESMELKLVMPETFTGEVPKNIFE